MKKYICIHGHFYQPPRENPWLERVELQDSAHPYHDWNERISEECYGPNAHSRLLNNQGKVRDIVSNYAQMSFNFGPTLLTWLARHKTDIYQDIIDANEASKKRFGGHPSAMAQGYNHIILPLATRRDKKTQIMWGIRDYTFRFGSAPEGLWLPETAVCLESLDVLAECGIKYTVLSQYQAKRYRSNKHGNWHDTSAGGFDPTKPYIQHLPSGRSIVLFFYDAAIARGAAFDGLLKDGKNFADRLMGAFVDSRKHAELVHIATDGETYGHHHRFGEMALTFALDHIASKELAEIINYGYFLEKFPPIAEVEIIENSSWSCSHGVERWKANCGCNSGGKPQWNQEWRKPFRTALDWLRDEVAPKYEERMLALGFDPWPARDAYIEVVLNRNKEVVESFFAKNCTKILVHAEKSIALQLLEMQRHAMLMYTSCGWFFDELSGIETVQCMQYAARVVQLGEALFETSHLERTFLNYLSKAKSNISDYGNGHTIYNMWIKPNIIDFVQVGAHFAVSAIFTPETPALNLDSYTVRTNDFIHLEAGKSSLVLGNARFTSNLTYENAKLCFAALHFGDHNINAGVRYLVCEDIYKDLVNEATDAFNSMDLPSVLRILDKYFGDSTYSLKSLFRDEQRRIIGYLLDNTYKELNSTYNKIYSDYYPLMRFLVDMKAPLPRALQSSASFVIESCLQQFLLKQVENDDIEQIRTLLTDAKRWDIKFDNIQLEHLFRRQVESLVATLISKPHNLEHLALTEDFIGLTKSLPFNVNLWRAQNHFFTMIKAVYSAFSQNKSSADLNNEAWLVLFKSICDHLSIVISDFV